MLGMSGLFHNVQTQTCIITKQCKYSDMYMCLWMIKATLFIRRKMKQQPGVAR